MLKTAKVIMAGLLATAILPVSAMALYDPENTSQPEDGMVRITAIAEPSEGGNASSGYAGGGSTGYAGTDTSQAGSVDPVAADSGAVYDLPASDEPSVIDPNTSVSSPVISEELRLRQGEVDRILFKENGEKLEEMGIRVNYTGVNGDVIEIGIMPYHEENAAVIIDLVGKESVKVIEALVAEPYTAATPEEREIYYITDVAGAADDEIYTTAIQEDGAVDAIAYTGVDNVKADRKNANQVQIILGAAAAAGVGAVLALTRKSKTSRKSKAANS